MRRQYVPTQRNCALRLAGGPLATHGALAAAHRGETSSLFALLERLSRPARK
jgi:hypothetical protein